MRGVDSSTFISYKSSKLHQIYFKNQLILQTKHSFHINIAFNLSPEYLNWDNIFFLKENRPLGLSKIIGMQKGIGLLYFILLNWTLTLSVNENKDKNTLLDIFPSFSKEVTWPGEKWC